MDMIDSFLSPLSLYPHFPPFNQREREKERKRRRIPSHHKKKKKKGGVGISL
jgi:hypothetical protein